MDAERRNFKPVVGTIRSSSQNNNIFYASTKMINFKNPLIKSKTNNNKNANGNMVDRIKIITIIWKYLKFQN